VGTSFPTDWGKKELQLWMISEFQEGWEVINDLLLQNGITGGAALLGRIDTLEVDESHSEFLPILLTAVERLRDAATCRSFCEALRLQQLEENNLSEGDESFVDEKLVQSIEDTLFTNLVCETLPRKYDPVGSSGACASGSKPGSKSTHVESECTVCNDEVSFVSFPECQHAYCKKCLRRHFEFAMSGDRDLPVKCCKQSFFSLELITSVVTLDELQEYCERLKSQSQDYKTRLFCPSPECSYSIMVGIFGSVAPKQIECPKCLTRICTDCRGKKHEGPCNVGEESNDIVGRQGWQQCPRCKVGVERTFGCNHMFCTSCRTEFCYSCGKEWDKLKRCSCSEALENAAPNHIYPRHHYEQFLHDDHGECEHGYREEREFRRPRTKSGVLRECDECETLITHYAWECNQCHKKFCVNCNRHLDKVHRNL